MNSRIFRCLVARIRPGEGEDSVKHFRAAIWEGLLASKPTAVRFRRFPPAAALGIKDVLKARSAESISGLPSALSNW